MALKKRGVRYVEIRILDVDTFSPIGLAVCHCAWMCALALFCLLQDSPPLAVGHIAELSYNQKQVAPLFTVFLAHHFAYNDKLNSQKIMGITLGLLGTLILVGPSALGDVGANLWGQLAVIAAALCFAMTAIYIRVNFQAKSGSPLDSPLETLTHQLFIATLVLIPFTLIIDQPWTLQPSLASVAALFASGWGTSIIALLLYYYIINTIGASVASTTLRFA